MPDYSIKNSLFNKKATLLVWLIEEKTMKNYTLPAEPAEPTSPG